MTHRRDFLSQSAHGFGALALAAMLQADGLTADAADANDVGSGAMLKTLHRPAKAKRIVQLFMSGAASHLDLWDHKPALEKHHGEASNFGEHVEAFQNGLGPWMKSPFKFRPYGQSGKMLSDVVAPLGDVVDEMAFIHNVVGKFGVFSGNGGDLTTGLPWQSIHNGQDYQHEPLRLLSVIAAPKAAVADIIERHKVLEDLIANGWMNLVVLDKGEFHRYTPKLSWQSVETEQPVTNQCSVS